MRDAGIPTATPYGIVEITPAREYLLVTEFFDGAKEIGDAEVDDDDHRRRPRCSCASSGTRASRTATSSPPTCWCATATCVLIDVAFVQVRPSPWRQAVDLANMMLVLAVRTDADRVYERALRFFTPDEIAEAFAAARGVASPTQLRTVMKQDGRDLLARFRALAPAATDRSRSSAGARRASGSRCRVIFVVLFVRAGERRPASRPPTTSGSTGRRRAARAVVMILMAQSVPSARHRCRASRRSRPDGSSAASQIDDERDDASGSTPTSRATARSR